MTDPFQFPSATSRHRLPLLFAGQAQKEFFVNRALGICDALLHPSIEGEIAEPPVAPAEGDCWLIGSGGSGVFAGRDGEIACRQLEQWLFIAPRDGMRVLDRQTGQHILHKGSWRRETALLSAPTGGATVDQEARAVIGELLAALSRSGILPEN